MHHKNGDHEVVFRQPDAFWRYNWAEPSDGRGLVLFRLATVPRGLPNKTDGYNAKNAVNLTLLGGACHLLPSLAQQD